MDITIKCAYGHKECEYVKRGKLVRCHKYIALKGKDPQSEEFIDQWKCVDAWIPVLLIENAQNSRSIQAATESFRNEMVNAQGMFNDLFRHALELQALPDDQNNKKKLHAIKEGI